MRRSGIAVVLAVLVALTAGGVVAGSGSASVNDERTVDCSYPIEVTDATGATVTIEEEPDRIVAVAPSAAQTLWAVDAEERVVGMPVGYTTAYLDGSQNRTNVLDSELNPITEEVVGLEPDLVLAANINSNDSVRNLRESGLTVVKFEQSFSIDDVAAKTRLTGQLVGNCEQASAVNKEMNATVEEVRERAADGPNPKVYYAMGGGWTAGPDTFIGDVIASAGGDNIATAAGIRTYDQISEEVVVSENPDYIVATSEATIPYSEALNSTTAVQEDQIITVDGNYMNQPGPRITEPLVRLSEAFNPEPDTPTPTTTTDAGTEQTTAGPDTTETPNGNDTGSGFGPGFGVPAALVALTAALFLGRRR